VIACAVLLCSAAKASGQEPAWEIEVHAGTLLLHDSTEGQGTLPGPGEPFQTLGGRSRKVSSWYFGDGARLMNELVGVIAPGAPARIVPIDGVLTAPLAERSNGIQFGLRVSRALTRRVDAEFNLDIHQGRLQVDRQALDALDISSASFEDVWRALAVDEPVALQAADVSSVVTVEGTGRQILTSGALSIKLRTSGTLVPYVTAGGGVVSNVGDRPSVVMEGRYRFQTFGLFPLEEFDTVILRDATTDHVLAGIVGGGFKYFMTPRRGLRVDVRAHFGASATRTLVSATPRTPATPPFQIALYSTTTPSLQISNASTASSTLSKPLSDFESFSGHGKPRPVSVTVGFFWRL
jgi:hypothetical protein